MSDSLWPHGLQHTRFPRPSLSPGVCSNSCSLSWWCHPTISSSVIPSPPALNLYQHQSFPVSWLSASCGQSIGALASVLPMSIQDWFSLGLLVWSLCSPGDSEESSPAPQFESISSLVLSFLYDPTHILTWVLEKLLFWLYGPLLTKWCLCFSFFYFKKNLFLTDWWLAYIIGLISVIHQHEITIGVSVVESSCSPRDPQESSATPQFKSISFLAFSLLYGPTVTSIHDYQKNHSFDSMDLCQQTNVCFLIRYLGLS